MKLTKLTFAVVVVATALFTGTKSHAQTLNYVPGDILIGFEQSGASSNYVVDLGAASQFINASPGSTLAFNLSTADLTAAVGSNWASNSQTNLVQWGLIGGSSNTGSITIGGDTLAKNTLFYTVGELVAGTQSTPPLQSNNFGNNTINSAIIAFASNLGTTPSSGSTASLPAVIEASAGANSFSDETGNQGFFGIGSSIEQPSSGSFTGPTNSVLDLYRLNATSPANTTPGTFLGTFSLGSSGVLTYTAAGASVPEPSTYGLLLVSGAAFFIWRQRRKVVAEA